MVEVGSAPIEDHRGPVVECRRPASRAGRRATGSPWRAKASHASLISTASAWRLGVASSTSPPTLSNTNGELEAVARAHRTGRPAEQVHEHRRRAAGQLELGQLDRRHPHHLVRDDGDVEVEQRVVGAVGAVGGQDAGSVLAQAVAIEPTLEGGLVEPRRDRRTPGRRARNSVASSRVHPISSGTSGAVPRLQRVAGMVGHRDPVEHRCEAHAGAAAGRHRDLGGHDLLGRDLAQIGRAVDRQSELGQQLGGVRRWPARRSAPAGSDRSASTARWNSPAADGMASSVLTLAPPPDSPKIVTLPGSPPKRAMLSRTHSSDATRSSMPTLPDAAYSPPSSSPRCR